jgi:hypothetical protein
MFSWRQQVMINSFGSFQKCFEKWKLIIKSICRIQMLGFQGVVDSRRAPGRLRERASFDDD